MAVEQQSQNSDERKKKTIRNIIIACVIILIILLLLLLLKSCGSNSDDSVSVQEPVEEEQIADDTGENTQVSETPSQTIQPETPVVSDVPVSTEESVVIETATETVVSDTEPSVTPSQTGSDKMSSNKADNASSVTKTSYTYEPFIYWYTRSWPQTVVVSSVAAQPVIDDDDDFDDSSDNQVATVPVDAVQPSVPSQNPVQQIPSVTPSVPDADVIPSVSPSEEPSDVPSVTPEETAKPSENPVETVKPSEEPKPSEPTEMPDNSGSGTDETPTETPSPEKPSEPEETEKPDVHVHDYVTYTENPTCTEGGYSIDKCSCGETTNLVNLPALGHDVGDDFKCIRCGEYIAGWYTADGHLLSDWDELTTVYGLDIESNNDDDIKTFSVASIDKESRTLKDLVENEDALSTGSVLVVPSSVTSIGDFAFADCGFLKQTIFSGSLYEIGKGAYASSGVTSFDSHDSDVIVGEGAFYDCSDLSSVKLGSYSVLNKYSFKDCVSLTSAFIPNGTKSVPDDVYYGCVKLETLKFADSVTKIEAGAFQNCDSLKSIDFNKVRVIGDGAFENCVNLTEIDLADVESIGKNAFKDCNITSLTIPASTTEVGLGAFVGNELVYLDTGGAQHLWENEKNDIFEFDDVIECIIGRGIFDLSELKYNSEFIFPVLEIVTVDASADSFPAFMFNSVYAVDEADIPSTALSDDDKLTAKGTVNDTIKSITLKGTASEMAEFSIYNISNLSDFDSSLSQVKTIKSGTFWYLPSLENFSLPDACTTIQKQFMCSCSLDTLVFPKGVTTYDSSVNSVCYMAVCPAIVYDTNVRVIDMSPSSLGVIKSYMLGISTLESVEFSDKTTEIQASAFLCREGSSFVAVPIKELDTKNVEIFNSGCFAYLNNLEKFSSGVKEWKYAANGLFTWYLYSFTATELNLYNCEKICDDYGFADITTLKTVNIPKCKYVGSGAFANTYLTEIYMPECTELGRYAFGYATFLTKVNAPKLETIGESAFVRDTVLTDVITPNIKTISSSAFYNCTSLAKIDLSSVTYIGSSAFSGCSSLTDINEFNDEVCLQSSAFSGTALESVKIPANATYYCTDSTPIFGNISTLKTVEFSDNLSVNGYANQIFYGSTNIETIIIDDVTNFTQSSLDIVVGRFSNLKKLNKLVIKSGAVADNLFNNTFNSISLRELEIDKGVTSIGDYAFSTAAWVNTVSGDWSGIKSIGEYAFRSLGTCTASETKHITETIDLSSVEQIGECAFWYACMYNTVILNDDLKTVPAYCFRNVACVNVNIPKNVETIGSCAYSLVNFYSSYRDTSTLKTIDFRGTTCDNLIVESSAFSDVSYVDTIYITKNVSFYYGYDMSADNLYIELSDKSRTFMYDSLTAGKDDYSDSIFCSSHFKNVYIVSGDMTGMSILASSIENLYIDASVTGVTVDTFLNSCSGTVTYGDKEFATMDEFITYLDK